MVPGQNDRPTFVTVCRGYRDIFPAVPVQSAPTTANTHGWLPPACFIGVPARGLGELQPLTLSWADIIFRANAKYFGQEPAEKNEKKCL